jgi:cyclophilin family peptidyl-prolyl cis-trans isomerase
VISRIVSLLGRTRHKDSPPSKPLIENLERRALMHAQATSIITDNRGEVQITFNAALDPSTVNSRSVFVFTPGADGVNGTADDVKVDGIVRLKTSNRRVWFRPRTAVPFTAGTTYMVKLNSTRMKGADGHRIDGEWNGAGVQTGDGTAGGDLIFISKRDKGAVPVARLSTVLGNIDVNLDTVNPPITYANFLHYANGGLWDYDVIHRSATSNGTPFVIQGGGFGVDITTNDLTKIPTVAPIKNEPKTSNTRGTIAMAKTSNPDSATSQWFFNESDNTFLDDPNNSGGFTVFGQVKNAGGLAVMDAIGGLPTKVLADAQHDPQGVTDKFPDNTSAFDETPVLNSNTTPSTLNPLSDLTLVRRIAILNKNVAFVPAT